MQIVPTFNESEIITAIKNSDGRAFKELAKVYYSGLYGFIWRKTRDPEAAQDILQDLFLNIWKLRETLDESKSLKPYLYASANNLIINYVIKKKREIARGAAISPEEIAASSHSENDLANYLNDILKDIPEKLREVFIMNKFEGFKYSEIAEMLCISEKTVESRMGRILKILRGKFSKYIAFLIVFMPAAKAFE